MNDYSYSEEMCPMTAAIADAQGVVKDTEVCKTITITVTEDGTPTRNEVYCVVEVDQHAWGFGTSIHENLEEASAAAQAEALRVAAVYKAIKRGFICRCGYHRIELTNMPQLEAVRHTGFVLSPYAKFHEDA